MAKSYSCDHVGKIYRVEPTLVSEWNDGNNEFFASNNSKFALFLGTVPKSLKGVKKRKKNAKKDFKQNLKNKKKLKIKEAEIAKNALWDMNYQKFKNHKFRENANSLYDELIGLANKEEEIEEKIKDYYFALPSARTYIYENCSVKYFTWRDMSFTERGIKVDPNICFLSIAIDGPTKVLQEIHKDYFQKQYKNKLYKVYLNKSTGKVELLLSEDLQEIKEIVEKYIHSKKRKRKKLKSTNSTNKELLPVSDFTDNYRQITLSQIRDHFSGNKYIQISSKLLRKHGRAFAMWENNNGQLEESIFIILREQTYSFVIWENINDNRACYVFKYKSHKFDDKLNRLVKLVTSEIKYKRENLFRGTVVDYEKLCFDDYKPIIHEYPKLYQESISKFISPHFKF